MGRGETARKRQGVWPTRSPPALLLSVIFGYGGKEVAFVLRGFLLPPAADNVMTGGHFRRRKSSNTPLRENPVCFSLFFLMDDVKKYIIKILYVYFCSLACSAGDQ